MGDKLVQKQRVNRVIYCFSF